MRRGMCAVVIIGSALVVMGLSASVVEGAYFVRGRVTEAKPVLPTSAEPVFSTTVLKRSHRYRISVSGTVSDWCGEGAKSVRDCDFSGLPGTFEKGKGVDALYCYAKWRCAKPELWRQLRINGKGIDELVGKAGKLGFSGSHTYGGEVSGIAGRLSFVSSDASPGNDSGRWAVTITDLGPLTDEKPICRRPQALSGVERARDGRTVDPECEFEVSYSVSIQGRYRSGKTSYVNTVEARGVLSGTSLSNLHEKSPSDENPIYLSSPNWSPRIWITITRGSYSHPKGGPKKLALVGFVHRGLGACDEAADIDATLEVDAAGNGSFRLSRCFRYYPHNGQDQLWLLSERVTINATATVR